MYSGIEKSAGRQTKNWPYNKIFHVCGIQYVTTMKAVWNIRIF